MSKVLNGSGMELEVYIEYMDTDRYPPEISFAYLEDLYGEKYKQTSFDVILLTDNNALEFVLSRRDRLFQNVPVVFCGVNNLRPVMHRSVCWR